MTQFEKFKNMDINQFAEWLDRYGAFDNSPWIQWFDELLHCYQDITHISESRINKLCILLNRQINKLKEIIKYK